MPNNNQPEFARRFEFLYTGLRAALEKRPATSEQLDEWFGPAGDCLFSSEKKTESQFELRQRRILGAAQYVVVTRRGGMFAESQPPRNAPSLATTESGARGREWLWPAAELPPTDLVYDCTEELLHGKAKPILCDLSRVPVRIFGLLPTQLENISLRATQSVPTAGTVSRPVRWELAFTDASERPIQGRLPFHIQLRPANGEAIWDHYLATNTSGTLSGSARLDASVEPGSFQLRVRSQLNGLTATLPIRLNAPAHDHADRLTSEGLTLEWAPQPLAW